MSVAGELVVVLGQVAVDALAFEGVRADTLPSLRRRLLSKLAPELSIASAEASRLAIRGALLSLKQAEFRGNGASLARTVEAFDAAVGAVHLAGVDPALLERAAHAPRARPLAEVMRTADLTLEKIGQLDRRAVAARLATIVSNASPDDVVRAVGARRLVARIVRWEGADAMLWRALDAALARAGGEAKVELPIFHESIDAERERDPLEELVEAVARKLDAAPATVVVPQRLGDLRFAESASDLKHVEVHRASNAIAQARAAASIVVHALAEGTPADRIAISFGVHDETAAAAIRRIFSEIRVPLASSEAWRAVDTPLARAALSALSYLDADPQRSDLRALAGSPFVTRVDAALVRARATERGSTWQKRIDAARALFAELCVGAHPTAHVQTALASDAGRASISSLEVGAHAENALAWACLVASLDALEAAAARLGVSRNTVDAAEFLRAIEASMRSASTPPPSARAGGVVFAELTELVAARIDVLVVIDANEGALPSHPNPSPILGGDLTARLREIDPTRAPTSASEHAAGTYAALANVAAHAKRVVLVHRSEQVEGAPLGPSPLVAWLVRNGVSEHAWHAGPLAGAPLTEREARLRKLAFQHENRPIVAPDESRRASTELARERFHAKKTPSALVGDLSADAPSVAFLNRALATSERPLAITALEDAARCGFRGMSRAVLALREAEEEGEAPDARARGQAVHEALRAAFAATMPLWRERPRDALRIRAAALAAAAKTLTARVDELSRTREVLHELVRRQAIMEVTRILDHSLDDLDFDPLLVEQSFGDTRDPRGWPSLVVSANGASAWLRGKIDRVDVRHETRSVVRAVDYKTGLNAAKDAHRDLGEAILQVPLYARAAMTSLDADRAEGLYLPARDIAAAIANRSKFEKAWDEIGAREKTRPELAERVLSTLAPLREGRFLPTPRHDRECDRCAYDGICRRPRFVVSEEDEDEA